MVTIEMLRTRSIRLVPLTAALLLGACAHDAKPELVVPGTTGAGTPGPVADPPPHLGHSDELEDDNHKRYIPTVSCKLRHFDDECPSPRKRGAWEGVVPASGSAAFHNILGMQTVHSTMLPSGRILLVSGSSWRNRNGTQYYPFEADPETPSGLFIRKERPFRAQKLDEYYELVNNAAIYDPAANTFYRVPVPTPEPDPNRSNHFAPNDLFCTGHQHLPNGNVLFTGGTQYYHPYRTGHNSTYVFDWRSELATNWTDVDWRQRPASNADTPWTFAGFMERGRWYPSLVPLLDGRLAIFSGFVDLDPVPKPDEMYVFEINSWIELFDPAAFDRGEQAWQATDVAQTEGSPFTTLINPGFKPTPDVKCNERCVEANKYDAFKLYPENYLQPDGRIFMTREGDWVSLRTCDAAFMRKTKRTYSVDLFNNKGELAPSFEFGPDRVEDVTSYGTSFRDPDTGQIHIVGGQPTSPGTLYPLNAKHPTHFAGGRASTRLESFTPPKKPKSQGSWSLDPDFLGEDPINDRTMHYAVALPTGQILIVNGGNYDFYGPVHTPILLTPQYKDKKKNKKTGYTKTEMVDALEPRLYHNIAVLLPDGRVFVSGGNSARATITPSSEPLEPYKDLGNSQPPPNLDQVETDVYFFDDGPMAKALPGQGVTPTENWTAEIFSPPYLFIDPTRRAEITSLEPRGTVDYTAAATIEGKRFSLFHSGVDYHLGLTKLPAKCPVEDGTLVLIKLPSATHGWENGQQFFELAFEPGTDGIDFTTPDARASMIPPAYYMLFYTDCMGKPAVAWMVRFDDSATAP